MSDESSKRSPPPNTNDPAPKRVKSEESISPDVGSGSGSSTPATASGGVDQSRMFAARSMSPRSGTPSSTTPPLYKTPSSSHIPRSAMTFPGHVLPVGNKGFSSHGFNQRSSQSHQSQQSHQPYSTPSHSHSQSQSQSQSHSHSQFQSHGQYGSQTPTPGAASTPGFAGTPGGGGVGGQGGSGSGAATTVAPTMDPDQLSDALLSAGVDLKEEENLLSSSVTIQDGPRGGQFSAYGQDYARVGGSGSGHGGVGGVGGVGVGGSANAGYGTAPATEFLNLAILRQIVGKSAAREGLRQLSDNDGELLKFLSVATREWISDVLTNAVVLNRHRRRSRNDVHSEVSRALRTMAVKDKEQEEKRLALRALTSSGSGDGAAPGTKKPAVTEETQYKAANATAAMMTGKKKYSWLTGGGAPGGGGGLPRPGSSRSDGGISYREAREEPQLAMRDLLGALEEKRFGVENTIIKGYAKLRN